MKKPGFFRESDGSLSMRRLLAAFFAVMAMALFALAFTYSAVGWYVFLPGIACIAAVLLLLFFTTWGEIAEVVKAASGGLPGVPGS